MPYQYIKADPGDGPLWQVRMWPHRSLSPRGFAVFIAATCAMFLFPLLALLGTLHLWVMLPFLGVAVALVWYFLRRNAADGTLCEDLTLWPDRLDLVRHNPRSPDQTWQADPYRVRIGIEETGGPVDNYITLAGAGRRVELGAFLSSDERLEIYHRLSDALRALDINRR